MRFLTSILILITCIQVSAKEIVVAVIDTGIELSHDSFKHKENIWVNKGETGLDSNGIDKSKNGIDDDKNGYIDDVHGFDFVTKSNNISDNHGHGTHISGIIASKSKSHKGLAPFVKIMTLKYYDPRYSKQLNLENEILAIKYAIKNGATIINFSGGGGDASSRERKYVKEATKKGIHFISAGGNGNANLIGYNLNKSSSYYPCMYGSEKDIDLICVGSLRFNLKRAPSSNYGDKWVDIFTYGHNIKSSSLGNKYKLMSGTSQATALITSVVSLMISIDETLTPKEVKNILVKASVRNQNLILSSKSRGYIDIKRIIEITRKFSELKKLGLAASQSL